MAVGQPEDPLRRTEPSSVAPGWSKITDYDKVKGYRGPAGERVASIKGLGARSGDVQCDSIKRTL